MNILSQSMNSDTFPVFISSLISGFFGTNSLSMFIYDSIRHMQNDEKITLQFMFK